MDDLPEVGYSEWSRFDIREALECVMDALEPRQVALILLTDVFGFSPKDGFGGMVAYWRDYRQLTDGVFQDLVCNKIAIDNSEGNWSEYGHIISKFLGIERSEGMVQQNLQHFVGTYRAELEGNLDCLIKIKSGYLIADGLPQVWTRSTLIPKSSGVFDVQSLPFQVRFVNDDDIIKMYLTGPTLLNGPVNYKFTKKI